MIDRDVHSPGVGAALRRHGIDSAAAVVDLTAAHATGGRLAHQSGSLDAAVLDGTLSSIRSDAARTALAAETWRALKPGGVIVIREARSPSRMWGVTRRTVKELFPRARLQAGPSKRPGTHRIVVARKPAPQTRVAHVTSAHPATDPRIYLKEVATLRDAGYDVTLIAPAQPAPPLDDPKIELLPHYTSRLARWSGAWRAALDATRRVDPDVVHFHDPELLPLSLLWRAQGRKVIYDAHESLSKDVAHKDYLAPWQSRILAPVIATGERAIARRMTHVVTATPAIAGQWSFGTTVVANYPILDEWAAIDSSRENFLARPRRGCYVGAIHSERCTEAVIAAAGIMRSTRDYTVVMAGPHGDANDPAGPGIEYVGVLSRAQVAQLTGSSLFGLAIFRPSPNIIEALPTKVLEYMAAGVPVILSSSLRVGAEMVTEVGCGIVVAHDRPTEIAEAMTRLADDPDLAWRMGSRGKAAVLDRYSWSSEGRRLVDAYRQHVGPPGTAHEDE